MLAPIRFVVLALAPALLTGTALAKTVLDQPGQFRIEFPDDFKVLRHGRAPNEPKSYFLRVESAASNLKIFAHSTFRTDPSYDFGKHFGAWEKTAIARGWYKWLKPVTPPKRVNAGKVSRAVAFYRVYDGLSQRDKTVQPYRLITLVSHNRELKRVFALTVAAHSDLFAKNRPRIQAIMQSFQPYLHAAPHKPGAAKPGVPLKRVSVKGLFKTKKTGLVVATKKGHAFAKVLAGGRPASKKLAGLARPQPKRPLSLATQKPVVGRKAPFKGLVAAVKKPAVVKRPVVVTKPAAVQKAVVVKKPAVVKPSKLGKNAAAKDKTAKDKTAKGKKAKGKKDAEE